jgi:hypothetical protein
MEILHEKPVQKQPFACLTKPTQAFTEISQLNIHLHKTYQCQAGDFERALKLAGSEDDFEKCCGFWALKMLCSVKEFD